MATIPDIDISTRRLDPTPMRPRLAPSIWGEAGRDVGGAFRAAGAALDRIAEVKDRADRQDAEYAVMQAIDFFRNGWNGYERKDEAGRWQHVPGVADRTWREMDADGTTSMDECAKLAKAVREQDFYKGLTPGQRRWFERSWRFRENEFRRAAEANHARLTVTRRAEKTKEQIEYRGAKVVAPTYGTEDGTYERTARWAALRNFADLQGTMVTNPEVLDDPAATFGDLKWRGGLTDEERERKLAQYRDCALSYDVNRITALQQAASNGLPLGAMPSARCLEKADEVTDGLRGGGLITDAQAAAIKAETQKARAQHGRVLAARQAKNASEIDGELDRLQWRLAAADGVQGIAEFRFNDEAFRAELGAKVAQGLISEGQALRELARYQKLHASCDALHSALTDPGSGFAERTDPVTWVRLNKMITGQERDGLSLDALEGAVEAAKPRLKGADYLALWKECRKRRDADDDRILNRVFARYYELGEDVTALALDTSKRGTERGGEALETLLGSGNAEYVRAGSWSNPDFTKEDVDAACGAVRRYLREHPGDEQGAERLVWELREPATRKARAAAYRDRILQLMKRNAGKPPERRSWSVDRAFEGGGDKERK